MNAKVCRDRISNFVASEYNPERKSNLKLVSNRDKTRLYVLMIDRAMSSQEITSLQKDQMLKRDERIRFCQNYVKFFLMFALLLLHDPIKTVIKVMVYPR